MEEVGGGLFPINYTNYIFNHFQNDEKRFHVLLRTKETWNMKTEYLITWDLRAVLLRLLFILEYAAANVNFDS